MKRHIPSFAQKLSTAFVSAGLLSGLAAHGADVTWLGTNGVSATTNWSDVNNFVTFGTTTHTSPVNNATDFYGNTTVNSTALVTVNINGLYTGQTGTSGPYSGTPQSYGFFFCQTNGYHNMLIQPGLTVYMTAANSTPGGGFGVGPAPGNVQGTSSWTTPGSTYTNYTTISGPTSTFFANGNCRVEGGASSTFNHYTILDMSGLGAFVHSNTVSGNGFYVVNGTARSQAIVYLAQTNTFILGGNFQIGYLATSSNSLPIGLYLGMTNNILTGAGNNALVVGFTGCSNGFMKFNPAFVGGATMPVAVINGANNGQTATICSASGSTLPGSAICDLTGGNVTWNTSTFRVGVDGVGPTNAAYGIMTFDNGTVTATTALIGDQTSSAGGIAVGTLNIGSNATFIATNISLPAMVGTPTLGTAGTINVAAGGTLNFTSITNGSGSTGTINISNANLGINLASLGVTNLVVTNFGAYGTTNHITITGVTPALGGPVPVRFHLLTAPNLTGVSTLGLNPLPAGLAGHLDTTTTPGVVDFVLTADPNAIPSLTWTGTNSSGSADGDWDVGATANWQINGVGTTYAQGDVVLFPDVASPGSTTVNLTTTETPFSVLVNNAASTYTFTGSGSFGGTASLTKQGTGLLVIDNTSPNTNTGGAIISAGTLQVGSADANGTLPTTGTISDNGTLAIDRTDAVTVTNNISGSGAVVEEGTGSLQLTGNNSFTGNILVTNNSTLQGGVSNAFGANSGSVVVASGSTFDVYATNHSGTGRTIVVGGMGTSSAGAAVINSGGSIGDSSGGLAPQITLTSDTWFGFVNRTDLGSPTGAILSTGGHPYSVIYNGGPYSEWRDVQADAALANIYVTNGQVWGFTGSSTFGNPAGQLNIASGSEVDMYNADSSNVSVNKQVVVNDGGTLANLGGANTIVGGLVVSNFSGGSPVYCGFTISSLGLTVAGPVTGSAVLWMQSSGRGVSSSTLTINGDASGFTGGALVPGGTFNLNSTMGSGITTQSGGILTGTGNANGLVDVGGAFYPGTTNVVGTFTAGSMTLEGSSTLNMDLSSSTGSGNDSVVVNGALTLNSGTLMINPIAGSLANGTYVLMTASGGISGTFGSVQTVFTTPYTLTVNITANQVQLIVSGAPANLVWNNFTGNANWDVQSSQNWTNALALDDETFNNLESVTFDDSILTAANPTTNVAIPSGVAVAPSVMTNNSSTAAYTIIGPGKFTGGGSIVKMGASTLTIDSTNDFIGPTTILNGTILAGNAKALGATNGPILVTNTGTLDINGFNMGLKPVFTWGAGAGGTGAIANSGAQQTSALRQVTMLGNTTFGGPGGNTPWTIGNVNNRFDLRSASISVTDSLSFLSTGGHGYKLSKTGSNQVSLVSVTVDPALGDIEIDGGNFSVQFLSTMGNPASNCIIGPNGLFDMYSCAVPMNKNFVLNGDGATIYNENSTNGIIGNVSLSGSNVFNIAGTSLILFSNTVSGAGSLNKWGASPLYLAGNNTYTGDTVVNAGKVALVGASSLSSAHITVQSGASIDLSLATPQTLAVSSGQILQGAGTISGNVSVAGGAAIVPGGSNTIGILTITNNAILSGTTVVDINASTLTNDVISAGGSITYGGTLNVGNLAGSVAAGQSYKLFNSGTGTYSGSFSSITPSAGPGLLWDPSTLNVGKLSVIASPSRALFVTNVVTAGTFTMSGTNGTAGTHYRVLMTTNLATPPSTWNVVGSGSFDASGNFSFSTNAPAGAAQFYILSEP